MKDPYVYLDLISKMDIKEKPVSVLKYINYLGFNFPKDEIVYILLFVTSSNIEKLHNVFKADKTGQPAVLFCKNVLKCLIRFFASYDTNIYIELKQLTKNLILNQIPFYFHNINISDGKKFIRFIEELMKLLFQIRKKFYINRIVESELISTFPFH